MAVSHPVHRGGGSASVHTGIADPPGADTPLGAGPLGADPPVQCILGDMANKRVVHILLECILVDSILFKILSPFPRCAVRFQYSANSVNYDKIQKWYGYQKYFSSGNKYIASASNTKCIFIDTSG